MTIPSYAMPDYIAAIVGRLKEFDYMTDWGDVEFRTDPMIDDTISDSTVNEFIRNVITVQSIPGFGQHTGLIMAPRFEIRSWGTNGYEAMLGWRLAHTVLSPDNVNSPHKSSFTKYGCHIYDISIVATPIRIPDPSGWESRSAFYTARVREVPVT